MSGNNEVWVHASSVIDEGAEIGDGTKIWHFTHIMSGAKIGKNVTIGQGCFVQSDVVIGDNCKIQNNVSVYKGVTLEDGVFIGPSVVFTNVRKPRTDKPTPEEFYAKTVVRRNASIGANATIVCGVEIGSQAMIGAGTVITKSVPPGLTVIGNPAGILVRDTSGVSFVVSFEQYYIKRRSYEK